MILLTLFLSFGSFSHTLAAEEDEPAEAPEEITETVLPEETEISETADIQDDKEGTETVPESVPGKVIDRIDTGDVYVEVDIAQSDETHIGSILPAQANVHFADTDTDGVTDIRWISEEYRENTYGSFTFRAEPDPVFEVVCDLPAAEVKVTMDVSSYIAKDQKKSMRKLKKTRSSGTPVKDQILSDYTKTEEILATDPAQADAVQKNYREAEGNTDTQYLLKSAEWTDIHTGEARIRLAASRTFDMETGSSHALFVFTDCPSHGWTLNKALDKVSDLLDHYQKVTLGRIVGPDEEGILLGDVSRDPDDENYYVYKLMEMPWHGGDHYSLNVYAALYKYFFGSFDSVTPVSKDLWPTVIYVQYDNLYEPCNYPAVAGLPAVTNVGVCDAYGMHYSTGTDTGHRARYDSSGQAYALGNAGRADSPVWDILKRYKEQGRYFSYALDGTFATRGVFSRWENTFVINASDIFRLNIFAGLAQPQVYDPATALHVPLLNDIYQRQNCIYNSDTGWQHVYNLEERYQPDYASVQEYIDKIDPHPQNMILSDVVSDDYEILDVRASKENAVVEIHGSEVSVTFPDYVSGEEASAEIFVKARYTTRKDWGDTNRGNSRSGSSTSDSSAVYTYREVSSPVLTRDGYTLTIHYLEKGSEKVLHPPYTGVYAGGEEYDVLSPEILMYALVDENDKEIQGVMPYEDKVIYVYYERDISIAEPVRVTKRVIGLEDPQDTFRFQLIPENPQNPMPEDGVDVLSIKGNGSAEFAMIHFPFDGEYVYTVKELDDGQFGYTMDQTVYTVKYIVEDGKITRTISDSSITPEEETITFSYTGDVQTFTAPEIGFYSLEAWGAQGGSAAAGAGGQGGYAKGTIAMNRGDTIYVVVGGQGGKAANGKNPAGGYNGGGRGHSWDTPDYDESGNVTGHTYRNGAAGGGATHFASADGVLSSLEDNKNAVILAAGGGGGAGMFQKAGQKEDDPRSNNWDPEIWKNSGKGGGLEGGIGGYGIQHHCKGGTQTGGYGFGKGQPSDSGVGAGGGGWFGGRRFTPGSAVGGGGSGYIQSPETLSSLRIQPDYPLTDASTELGGRTGNGMARITYKISNETGEASFTNTYTVTDTEKYAVTEMRIQKTIRGQNVQKSTLRFVVKPEDDTYPMPESPEQILETDHSEVISFGKITFKRPGTYSYIIKEIRDPDTRQFTWADDLRITYVVSESEDGTELVVLQDGEELPEMINYWNTYDLVIDKTGIDESFEDIEFIVQTASEAGEAEKYALFERTESGEYLLKGETDKQDEASVLKLNKDKQLILHGLTAGDYAFFEQNVQEGYLPEENGTLFALRPASQTDYALGDQSEYTDTEGKTKKLRVEGNTAYGEIHNRKDDTEPEHPHKRVCNEAGEDINGQCAEVNTILYYFIDIRNNTKVRRTYEICDPLPEDTEFLQADHDGTEENGEVKWPAFVLEPQEKMTVGFTVKVLRDGKTYVNKAEVKITGKTYETNEVINPSIPDPVKRVVDLEGKDIHGKYVSVNEEYEYQIEVSNPGGTERTFTITDVVPEHTEFIRADHHGVCKNGQVQWTVKVKAGKKETVSFRVKAVREGVTIPNTAEVRTEKIMRKTNTVEVHVPVSPEKQVLNSAGEQIDGQMVNEGDVLTYVLQVKNLLKGKQACILEDTIPEETELIRVNDQGTVNQRTVQWKLEMNAGETREVSFEVKVKTGTKGKTIRNQGILKLEDERTLKTNTVTNSIPEDPVKTITNVFGTNMEKKTLEGGKRYTYQITVRNPKSTDQEVMITDTLPKEVTFVSATQNGTLQGNTVTWKITVKANSSQTVKCVVITPKYDASVSNKAKITLDNVTLETNTVTSEVKAPEVIVDNIPTGIDQTWVLIPCAMIVVGVLGTLVVLNRKK